MEPEIHTSLSAGSPILAYGESRDNNGRSLIIKLLLGLVALFCVFMIWTLFSYEIPFPSRVPVLTVLKDNSLLQYGPGKLWTSAPKHGVRYALFGLAWTEDGLSPFTLTLKVLAPSAAHHYDFGPFSLSSDKELELSSRKRALEILGLLMKLGSNDAYLTADLGAIGDTDRSVISGPIKDGAWKTDIEIKNTFLGDLPDGDLLIDLDAAPEAWTMISTALQNTGLSQLPSERPSYMSWTVASGSIPSLELGYPTTISSSTMSGLAASAGKYRLSGYTLPDGDYVQEMLPPKDGMGSNGLDEWEIISGTRARLTRGKLIIDRVMIDAGSSTDSLSSSVTSTRDALKPVCDSGSTVLHLKKPALKLIADRLSIPDDIFSGIDSMTASENGGKLRICWK